MMRKSSWILVSVLPALVVSLLGCSKGADNTGAAVDHAKVWQQEDHAGLDALTNNDLTGAEKHLLTALTEAEACGPNDGRVAGTLNNLASVYEKKEMYKQALPLLKRALDIFKTNYGEKAQFVPIVTANIARVSAKAGENDKAAEYYAEAVRLKDSAPNEDWKQTLTDYAQVLKKLDKNDEAKEVEAQAAKIEQH